MKDFWDGYTHNADGKLVRRGYVSLSEQPPKNPPKELASTLAYAARYGQSVGCFIPDPQPIPSSVELPKQPDKNDEIHALGIVYVFSDGRTSPVFHISGSEEFDPTAPEADLIHWDENLMV